MSERLETGTLRPVAYLQHPDSKFLPRSRRWPRCLTLFGFDLFSGRLVLDCVYKRSCKDLKRSNWQCCHSSCTMDWAFEMGKKMLRQTETWSAVWWRCKDHISNILPFLIRSLVSLEGVMKIRQAICLCMLLFMGGFAIAQEPTEKPEASSEKTENKEDESSILERVLKK